MNTNKTENRNWKVTDLWTVPFYDVKMELSHLYNATHSEEVAPSQAWNLLGGELGWIDTFRLYWYSVKLRNANSDWDGGGDPDLSTEVLLSRALLWLLAREVAIGLIEEWRGFDEACAQALEEGESPDRFELPLLPPPPRPPHELYPTEKQLKMEGVWAQEARDQMEMDWQERNLGNKRKGGN